MPIVMKRKYSLDGNYTDEQKERLTSLIDLFRVSISDDDPERNILNKKTSRYSDKQVIKLLERAIKDINGGQPLTKFTIYDFTDDSLLIDGTVVFSMIAEGILQLSNKVDYSDSGLSIALFNKSPEYQGWAGFLLQNYMRDKAEFKAAYIGTNSPSIFVGISSEFGYYFD